MVVDCDSDSGELLDLVRQRYAGFAASTPAELSIHYSVNHRKTLDARELAAARTASPETRRDKNELVVIGQGYRARCCARSLHIEGPQATYPIDQCLAAMWLERHPTGLLVHGAALIDGDRGILCIGESGAGKSTVARLFPAHALCDEVAALTVADGAVELHGLPFWQGRPGRARLETILWLRHGARHRLTRLRSADALAKIRSQIIWPLVDHATVAQSFDTLAQIERSTPVFTLEFLPEPGVAEYLFAHPLSCVACAGART